MVQLHDFRLDRAGHQGVRILLCRDALPSNGDFESDFLEGVAELNRFAPETSFIQALLAVAGRPETATIAVLRNPKLVLCPDLAERITQAAYSVRSFENWSVAAAGGLGLADARHLSLYASAQPAIPLATGPHPLLDAMPDLYLVDAAFVRAEAERLLAANDTALETVLCTAGYISGRVAVHLPALRAGIDGALLSRDLTELDAGLSRAFRTDLAGQSVQTLSGAVSIETGARTPPVRALADDVAAAIAPHCAPLSVSVVTRTRFERMGLLRRLLTSLSRARLDGMDLEVVLSSDAPLAECSAVLACLQRAFVNLDIRLQHNSSPGPSRVVNLTGGIAAARHDYVTVIDDDDYVDLFAFKQLRAARFAGNLPLIVATNDVHEEVWETTPSGRSVLTASTEVRRYAASGWRRMFSGVNQLPISALLIPRALLAARLEAISLLHDLSEDYALFLALFTDPELPEIHESGAPFVHISLRGRENSVTMPDRRPWVRDISAHLSDLTGARGAAGPGLWALLGADRRDTPLTETSIEDLRGALAKRDSEIALLRREASCLRENLTQLQELQS